MRHGFAAIVALALGACSSGDAVVPPECAGAYRLQVEKTVYLVSPKGGTVPDHCGRYAVSLEEHLVKQPLPPGYVNCRTADGRIVGMKPATCSREGGTALD